MVSYWLILFGLVFALFLAVQISKERRKYLKPALIGGLVLAFADIFIETIGMWAGLWLSYAPVKIGGAPVVVLLIAFFGGAAFLQLLPKVKDTRITYIFTVSLLASAIEQLLIKKGLFEYFKWWDYSFCWLSYVVVFIGLIYVYDNFLISKIK